MSEHFNELTPAEAERLALLAEEMGETIQVIGKILRHGYESFNPFFREGGTNRDLLAKEVADALVIIDMLIDAGDISESDLEDRKRVKRHKIVDYLHHQ